MVKVVGCRAVFFRTEACFFQTFGWATKSMVWVGSDWGRVCGIRVSKAFKHRVGYGMRCKGGAQCRVAYSVVVHLAWVDFGPQLGPTPPSKQ